MDNSTVITDKKILLVEDEAIIAMQTEMALKKYGYEVFTVNNGESAVQFIENNDYIDLILMDINLGDGIDGTEAARRILEIQDLPVIFHSSHTEPEIVEKTEKITSYGYIVKNSGNTVLDTSIKMAFKLFESVTTQRKLNNELRESEERFHRVLNVIPDMVSIHDNEMNILYSNWQGFADIPDDKRIVGTKCYYTYRDLDNICPDCQAKKVIRTKEAFQSEVKLPEGLWIDLRVIPILDEKGDCSYFVEWVRDITQWKESASALELSEQRFRHAIEGTRDGLWDWNLETNETFFSPRFSEMLGYSENDLPGSGEAWRMLLHPDDKEIAESRLKDYLEKRTSVYESTFRMRTKDGNYRYIIGRGQAVWNEDGKAVRIIGFNTDITDLKGTESDLKNALARNKVLFDELQHRVKNSFGLITGMINLMKSQLKSAEAVKAIDDIGAKVVALSGVYQLLCEDDSKEKVNLKEYIIGIMDSLPSPSPSIHRDTDIEDIRVNTKKAVNIGLIFSEVLTNAYKHAFKEQNGGKISIKLKQQESKAVLIFTDDGAGLPEDYDVDKQESLGLKLIFLLANEIGLEVNLKRNPHVEWTFSFDI